jgi:integrase
LAFEGLEDIHVRFVRGHYFDPAEIDAIAHTSSVTTPALRRLNNTKVTLAQRGKGFGKKDYVSNTVKHRRLSNFSDYLELVGRISEARLSSTEERLRLSGQRREMCDQLRELRPKVRSSRVRGKIPYQELGKVVKFVANAKISEIRKIWPNEPICVRNFAIITVLVNCGLREGELRQLRADDLDLNQCTMMVARRPDDPEDPRTNEPNAKTSDRIIPLQNIVVERLERYVLGPGSDAAEASGSPFLFLSDGNRSRGKPIGRSVVFDAVRSLGAHLGIPNLYPHALRSAWVQSLVDWAIENEINQGELDRFANYLGGWS